MKKICLVMLVMSLLAIGAGEALAEKYTIGTVVKVDGIAWFDRMREGVEKFGEDTGHETFLLGPPKADAALQVQIIEDLIAQGVDAITVVPFSPEALEPVLKKAMDQGIVVISHEATNQQNVHYNIEAFDNAGYGAHLMDHLAKYMGEEGEYAVFVGSLTSKSHNEWVDAAIARQKEAYPNMKLVTERIEEYDDQTVAYEKTKELLKTYPNLKGIQGSAMSTAPGAGLAVEEKGLQEKVMVVGTSLVSVAGQYLESGGTKLISFWDPADAGYAMNTLAVMVLEGKEITEGMDLGLTGYDKIKKDGKLLFGSAWVDVTQENMDDYDF
ncbi:LacI family transcriptional regulator [candidate division KSB3 bacterium]|uniref:LacI family transcriptional regulator n=1 Tax=candidate division KSB3 bacterium TaxID=2044937 RepID=A0A2G6KF44_9BACT|nr:MAG: LacI family transcriptional regulator [candidate division KSB3 bacterium]